jgi:hypothetical protein
MNCKKSIVAMAIIGMTAAAWADTNTGKMPLPPAAKGAPCAPQSCAPAPNLPTAPNSSVHYKGWIITDPNCIKVVPDINKPLIIKPKGQIDYAKIQAYLKVTGQDKVVVHSEQDAMPVIVANADHYPMATGFAGTFESPMPQIKP